MYGNGDLIPGRNPPCIFFVRTCYADERSRRFWVGRSKSREQTLTVAQGVSGPHATSKGKRLSASFVP